MENSLLESLGLDEEDMLDLESSMEVIGLNSLVEFEFFWRMDMKEIKEYLAKHK